MTPLVTAFIFVFGAIVGSFLNAVLWRLHSGESIAHGRSHCPACMHVLGVADLIPVASWLLLGGKCRYCRKEIGVGYLVIELVTGALFVLAAQVAFGAGEPGGIALIGSASDGALSGRAIAALLLHWYFLAIMVVVFTFDLRHMLILRSVTMPATLVALAANLALGRSPMDLAIGVAVGAGIFWVQYALSKGRWIGGGDIHLGALMGAMLGWKLALAAVFMAYMVGAAYGIAVLLMRKKEWKSEIPFGTFLSVSTGLMLLYGERIVTWYFGLLS
ncbi:MAG: hypothetical protein RLZZ324_230 [Candidatus Parcubacteria bacterium]|jgi:prepilin signal peptidase PulO-like enzyme (type II secretory pathway)